MGESMRSYFYVLLLLAFVSSAKAEEISARAYYGQGKVFFEAGQDKKAEEMLALVPMSDNIYGRKSQYVLAASYTKQGQFDKAHDCFEQIIKAKIQSISDRSLRDLAVLGKARLYYQENKMREAILTYQKLGLDSVYASLMLYELGMTYIHYGDSMYEQPLRAKRVYQSAAGTLEELFKLNKQVFQDPRVRLLAVDLSMRLEEGPKAALLYRDMVHILIVTQQRLQDELHQENKLPAMLLAKQDDAEIQKTFSWVYSHGQVKKVLNQLRGTYQAQEEIKNEKNHYEVFLQMLLRDGKTMAIIDKAQQQIVNLNRLEQQANALEVELRSLFLKTVKEAIPSWLEQINWLLAGANSGLVRSVLREQYQQDENIRQIEMIKAKELLKIKKESELSHGGSL